MQKSFVVLALAASLVAGRPALLNQVWSFLTSAWSEEGFGMDPDGAPAPQTDEGCIMDPNGRCAPVPRTYAGCIMDPDGRCLSAPQVDEGCGMDPNG